MKAAYYFIPAEPTAKKIEIKTKMDNIKVEEVEFPITQNKGSRIFTDNAYVITSIKRILDQEGIKTANTIDGQGICIPEEQEYNLKAKVVTKPWAIVIFLNKSRKSTEYVEIPATTKYVTNEQTAN